MAAVQVRIRGAREVREFLQGLPEKIARRHVGAALRAGAKIIAERAAQLAPQETGTLSRSLVVRVTRSPRIRDVRATIGTSKEAWYAHLVEFGTAPHRQPRMRRTHPGTAARPFLRPAEEQSRAEVVRVAGEVLRRRLEAEARRAARRGTQRAAR